MNVPCEMHFAKGKEKNFLVVFTRPSRRGDVERSLAEAGFQSVPVPTESGSAKGRIDFYTNEIAALNKEIAEINTQLESVKQKHSAFLVACEELLKAEVDQTEAPLRFATTKQTFVAEGWVPTEKVTDVTNSPHPRDGREDLCHGPADRPRAR